MESNQFLQVHRSHEDKKGQGHKKCHGHSKIKMEIETEVYNPEKSLITAIRSGHRAVLENMLNFGANVETKDEVLKTSLKQLLYSYFNNCRDRIRFL
jgi:hypothetical protein